jgi:hypothetical protein
MINKISIDEIGTVWKIHYDLNENNIYLELRIDKSFELRSVHNNRIIKTNFYDQYVQNIISIQYPYAVISYRHIDNLLDDQIICLYNLETEKEEWISSDIRVDEVYNQSLRVYHPKISPKSFYHINFKKENIDSPLAFTKELNIVYAENYENNSILLDDELKVEINFDDDNLKIEYQGKLVFEEFFQLNEDYRPEYEYLMKVNNYIIFMLGKHKMNIYQMKPNNY